jgi:hypothetical protein
MCFCWLDCDALIDAPAMPAEEEMAWPWTKVYRDGRPIPASYRGLE